MIPWNKLPEDAQKAILTMILVFGGTSASCRLGPPICDPPPPPATTPMLCDPPPPPSTTPRPTLTLTPSATPTRTPSPTPMICDPAPPPSVTPMICDPPPPPPPVTVAPGQHFTVRTVQIETDQAVSGVVIRGAVVDQDGQPLGGLPILISHAGAQVERFSDGWGAFYYSSRQVGDYVLSIRGDAMSQVNLNLKRHDVVIVEWMESREDSQAPLPLAEIRSVDIVWQEGFTFGVETPWPGARYRWSVSGGRLVETHAGVTWQPALEPGRYLLQVVADWGRAGLAVDAVVLVVAEDGGVSFG